MRFPFPAGVFLGACLLLATGAPAQPAPDGGKQPAQSLSHEAPQKQPAQSMAHDTPQKQQTQSLGHDAPQKQQAQSMAHGTATGARPGAAAMAAKKQQTQSLSHGDPSLPDGVTKQH